MVFKHSAREAQDQLDKIDPDAAAGGQSKWPGMNYEQGVAATLEWLLDGYDDEEPMED